MHDGKVHGQVVYMRPLQRQRIKLILTAFCIRSFHGQVHFYMHIGQRMFFFQCHKPKHQTRDVFIRGNHRHFTKTQIGPWAYKPAVQHTRGPCKREEAAHGFYTRYQRSQIASGIHPAITYSGVRFETEIKQLFGTAPVIGRYVAGKFMKANGQIHQCKQKINRKEKCEYHQYKLPCRYVEHGVVKAKPFPGPFALAPDIESAIGQHKSVTVNSGVVAKSGIVVGTGKRSVAAKAGHIDSCLSSNIL